MSNVTFENMEQALNTVHAHHDVFAKALATCIDNLRKNAGRIWRDPASALAQMEQRLNDSGMMSVIDHVANSPEAYGKLVHRGFWPYRDDLAARMLAGLPSLEVYDIALRQMELVGKTLGEHRQVDYGY